MITGDTLLTLLVGGAGTGIGGYIAMRVALARIEERISAHAGMILDVKTGVNRAHERIDDLVSRPNVHVMHGHTPGVAARRPSDR